MHRLLDALKRILQPPAKKELPLIQRSALASFVTKLPTSRHLQPTEEEATYLTFFTNYCKRDDFQAYRSQFPDDFDLSFRNKPNNVRMELTSDFDASSSREHNGKE